VTADFARVPRFIDLEGSVGIVLQELAGERRKRDAIREIILQYLSVDGPGDQTNAQPKPTPGKAPPTAQTAPRLGSLCELQHTQAIAFSPVVTFHQARRLPIAGTRKP
jgi:hypothetical protein